MNFHPDVLAAHAEFGGDLETMQKLYDYPELERRAKDAEAELARFRSERSYVVGHNDGFSAALSRPIDPKAEVDLRTAIHNGQIDAPPFADDSQQAFNAAVEAVFKAISASPSIVAPVGVKPLEWREAKTEDGREQWHSSDRETITVMGEAYGKTERYWLFHAKKGFATLEAAKSAAQSDYEARILSALSTDAAAQDDLERMRKALEDAEETLRLVEHPKFPDPQYHEQVKALGRQIGFGALMSTASAAWREVLAEKGYPLGGEFVSGPCHGTVVSTLATMRAALSRDASRDEEGSQG